MAATRRCRSLDNRLVCFTARHRPPIVVLFMICFYKNTASAPAPGVSWPGVRQFRVRYKLQRGEFALIRTARIEYYNTFYHCLYVGFVLTPITRAPVDRNGFKVNAVAKRFRPRRRLGSRSSRRRFRANTDEDNSGGSGCVWSVGGPWTRLVAPRTCSHWLRRRARVPLPRWR